uniref:Uncharacterized protein n=1 Tax=Myoviridae sp. ctijX18 TaxID=2825154 RepID=A0A8S5USL1_9CAUD|nr:MAG TPA: hypothetical protein [Myoviridae sp. ctijX18]DAJ68995.1 MAG TPA: hypothetical protein [Caudoviricetes sp.]
MQPSLTNVLKGSLQRGLFAIDELTRGLKGNRVLLFARRVG